MHGACRAVICRAGVMFVIVIITSLLLGPCIFVVISQPDSSELTAVEKCKHVNYIHAAMRKNIVYIYVIAGCVIY